MKKNVKGLTLVEVTVALAISTIVLSGASVLFISFNKLYEKSKKESLYYSEMRLISNALDNALNSSVDNSVSITEQNFTDAENKVLFVVSNNQGTFRYFYDTQSLTCFHVENEETSQVLKTENNYNLSIQKEVGGPFFRFDISSAKNPDIKIQLIRAISYEI